MVDITYRNKEKIEEIRKKKIRVQRVARFVSIVFAAGELSGYEAEAGNYSSEEELLAKINRFEDTAITKRDVSLINDQNEISNIVILNTCTPKGSYVEDEVEKDNGRTLVYAKVTKVLDKTLQNQVSEGMHR